MSKFLITEDTIENASRKYHEIYLDTHVTNYN